MEMSTMKRIVIYIMGMWVVSLGIVLNAKADLGVSAISALPYAVFKISILTFGTATMFFHIANVIFQGILRKKCDLRIVLQIIVSVIFGKIIDLLNGWITVEAKSVLLQITILVAGIVFTALGTVLMIHMDLVNNPPDGAVKVISQKTGKEFGKTKVRYDITMVVITCVFCLLTTHTVIGIGVGTVASALCVGKCASMFNRSFATCQSN
ncbi:MAG: rane protein [Firmicutes bacterium]|nr:rane protein [Bacillota bacterium]